MTSIVIGLILVLIGLATTARADCPEGSRAISEREQQGYLSIQQAIKAAIPPAPAGWSLKDPTAKFAVSAPKDNCKGSDPSPGWFGTYAWDEEFKRASARDREQDARVRKASAWTLQEEKEMHEYERQGRDLERKAVAVIRTDPGGAARLRTEARPFSEKANAVRKAHNERIAPEVEGIRKEYAAGYVNPLVTASVVVNDADEQLSAKEPLQIPGATSSFINGQKELVMSFGQFPSARESGGIGAKPRTLWVTIAGARDPAETIARLFAGSSMSTLAKK